MRLINSSQKSKKLEQLAVEFLLDQMSLDICSQNSFDSQKHKDEAFKSLAKFKSSRKHITPLSFGKIKKANNGSDNYVMEKIQKNFYFIFASFSVLEDQNSHENNELTNSIKIKVNSFLSEIN